MKGIISRKGKQAVIYAQVNYLDDGKKSVSVRVCSQHSAHCLGHKMQHGSLFKESLFNAPITNERMEFINFIFRINRHQRDVTLMLMQGLPSLRQALKNTEKAFKDPPSKVNLHIMVPQCIADKVHVDCWPKSDFQSIPIETGCFIAVWTVTNEICNLLAFGPMYFSVNSSKHDW